MVFGFSKGLRGDGYCQCPFKMWSVRCRRCGWGEAVAEHDLHHFCAIRWAAASHVDCLGHFAKILRPDGGRRDHAQHLCVLRGIVVETVHAAARDAKRLSRADVDLPAVDGPGEDAFDAVDGFFVVVVAVRGPARRCAPGTTTSNAAIVPADCSPVSRKWTTSGPIRIVSSAGFVRRSIACCAI